MIENILPVLTFAGLAVGFASTIWGLFAKPTVEDEKGNTRLTSQGQVTVALAGFAFLISLSSFGFGLLVERAKAEQEAQDALVKLEQQRVRDEKERLQEVRDLKQFALTEDALDETVNARFEQYRNELKRQADHARAARRISGENKSNLAGITSTLDGVERLLQPITRIAGDLEWRFELKDKAESFTKEMGCETGTEVLSSSITDTRLFLETETLPNGRLAPEYLTSLLGSVFDLKIVAQDDFEARNPLIVRAGPDSTNRSIQLNYFCEYGTIQLITNFDVSGEQATSSSVNSILDMQNAEWRAEFSEFDFFLEDTSVDVWGGFLTINGQRALYGVKSGEERMITEDDDAISFVLTQTTQVRRDFGE